jgi:hypothetical protein
MENEHKIRKVLFNEISFLIAGIGLVSSVIFWVTNPQTELKMQITKLQGQIETNQTVTQELEKIKNNDFVEIHIKLKEIEESQTKMLIEMGKLQTIIEKKL